MLEERLAKKTLRMPDPVLYMVTPDGIIDNDDPKALTLFQRRISGAPAKATPEQAANQPKKPKLFKKIFSSWEKLAPWGAAFISGLFASAIWNIFFD